MVLNRSQVLKRGGRSLVPELMRDEDFMMALTQASIDMQLECEGKNFPLACFAMLRLGEWSGKYLSVSGT